jgi:hypothetical protein
MCSEGLRAICRIVVLADQVERRVERFDVGDCTTVGYGKNNMRKDWYLPHRETVHVTHKINRLVIFELGYLL